jgi:hypothetical protein
MTTKYQLLIKASDGQSWREVQEPFSSMTEATCVGLTLAYPENIKTKMIAVEEEEGR